MSLSRLFAAVPLLAGCSEIGLHATGDADALPGPRLSVVPEVLEFDALGAGEEEIGLFTLLNDGDGPVEVTDLALADHPAFQLERPFEGLVIPPGELRYVDVVFSPMADGPQQTTGAVTSDDPVRPTIELQLLGMGRVPFLVFDPPVVDFGTFEVPCGDTVEVTMTNTGSQDLEVDSLMLSETDWFTADLPGMTTLDPGESRTLWLTVETGSDTTETATVDALTSDPRGTISLPMSGTGVYRDPATENFVGQLVPPQDVLFLVDTSCSMVSDNIDDIEKGIPDFIAELQALGDWQLIEVTQFDGCSNVGVVDDSTPGVAQLLVDNAFVGGPSERLLELAADALGKTTPGQCNEGFLRPEAMLHIIVASDEPEQSGVPWSDWLAVYSGYKSDPSLVTVSAVVDHNSQCGTGAAGYVDAAQATGGALLNVCNKNWGSSFGGVAAAGFGNLGYALAEPAVPDTVEVTVDGVPTTHFSYSEITATVVVSEPALVDGSDVQVDYIPAGVCSP